MNRETAINAARAAFRAYQLGDNPEAFADHGTGFTWAASGWYVSLTRSGAIATVSRFS